MVWFTLSPVVSSIPPSINTLCWYWQYLCYTFLLHPTSRIVRSGFLIRCHCTFKIMERSLKIGEPHSRFSICSPQISSLHSRWFDEFTGDLFRLPLVHFYPVMILALMRIGNRDYPVVPGAARILTGQYAILISTTVVRSLVLRKSWDNGDSRSWRNCAGSLS